MKKKLEEEKIILERKMAEEALEEQEQRLQQHMREQEVRVDRLRVLPWTCTKTKNKI